MVKIVATIVIMALLTVVSHGGYAEQFSIEQIEADTIDYKADAINLYGNVRVKYAFGFVTCDKAFLELAKKGVEKSESGKSESGKSDSGLNNISLEGHVKIDFPDGDTLASDRADMNCKTMVGVFTADDPNKVIYISTMQQGDKKVPIKATSKKFTARLVKNEGATGYHLGDLQGEGAVLIEYLKPQGQ